MKHTSELVADTTTGPNPAEILDRQRTAYLRDGAPDLATRRADLGKLRALLVENRRALEEAVAADFGHRSHNETAIMELVPTVEGIDYLSKNLRRFMAPERRHVSAVFRMARARVAYQPLGVVGIISPWNYPLNLALMPLATALAAGNSVMLKPSELTPRTSALMQRLLKGAFKEDKVAVVTGDAEVAKAFSALPFDHLMFTGSTKVGRAVMRAASDNLTPVTLELGGKSPTVVARGAVGTMSARRIAYGKLANAGQTCVAPDYALVHQDDVEAFTAAFDAATGKFYPGGPTSDDYSTIVSDGHFDRLTGLIEDARAKGARIVTVGHDAGDAAKRNRTIAPTLILDPTGDMDIMQEEIFGPILPIMTYRTLEEAIAFVNCRPRPLALYWFGPSGEEQDRLLTKTTSGNVGINSTVLHVAQDDLPFGGVGESGIGAYHGIEGFRRFSHAKGIYAQGRWNLADLAMAPFGRVAEQLLKFMLR
ncbi:coniferyl aldehyde dehydrogenase [Jiella marina]|uniref:coniferyl aldehyde dehydrogenase n=1 Tax=Jiella sp. LLJ827 TaxID=2917712 RepID=UPI00210084DB|nr:coniferyl aldehyde dehydrogenase [Jiella sp. LLJ827]MCQ0990362.1 coniferyl aldehyde dehydrogenase [Jiella sp. LLJ827]